MIFPICCWAAVVCGWLDGAAGDGDVWQSRVAERKGTRKIAANVRYGKKKLLNRNRQDSPLGTQNLDAYTLRYFAPSFQDLGGTGKVQSRKNQRLSDPPIVWQQEDDSSGNRWKFCATIALTVTI
jgi:hypothetical protein